MKTPIPAEQVLDEHLELSRSGDEENSLKSYRENSFIIMPDGARQVLRKYALASAHSNNNCRMPVSPIKRAL